MNYWEKNDGYQHVSIYDDEEENCLKTFDLEHSRGKASLAMKEIVCEAVISLTDLWDDDLYIRFGASGKYNDTWHNSDLTITLTFGENK